MRSLAIHSLAVITILLGTVVNTQAQFAGARILAGPSFNLMGGYPSLGCGIGAETPLLDLVGMGLLVQYDSRNEIDYPYFDLSSWQLNVLLTGSLHLTPSQVYDPYIGIRVGYQYRTFTFDFYEVPRRQETTPRDRFMLQGVLGCRYFLSSDLAVNAAFDFMFDERNPEYLGLIIGFDVRL